jgi:hypothetical protein
MNATITYSLREGHKHSDQYYRDIDAFTDHVLDEAQSQVGNLVGAFQTYLQQTGREVPRTPPEHVFELLTLGVLWRVYAGHALGLSRVPQRALAHLVRLRERSSRLKPVVDLVRGALGGLFLSPNGRYPTEVPAPTLNGLERLLSWLAANGDVFGEEVKRLRAWQDFLARQPSPQATENLAAAIAFAAWFETQGEVALGRYTPQVECFLAETHPGYRWREDVVFCGRRRVEYHLNMVGTEILNRAFRGAFLNTARKVVIAPPCMRAQPDGVCQASPTPLGECCVGCTPGCRVHQLTKLGAKHGFQVLLIPHELAVFSGEGAESAGDGEVGLVGVSCVLTNPPGGWQMKELSVPAQGVLLDYCGCSYHWHKEGFPTDINFAQLLRTLGVDETAGITHSATSRSRSPALPSGQG